MQLGGFGRSLAGRCRGEVILGHFAVDGGVVQNDRELICRVVKRPGFHDDLGLGSEREGHVVSWDVAPDGHGEGAAQNGPDLVETRGVLQQAARGQRVDAFGGARELGLGGVVCIVEGGGVIDFGGRVRVRVGFHTFARGADGVAQLLVGGVRGGRTLEGHFEGLSELFVGSLYVEGPGLELWALAGTDPVGWSVWESSSGHDEVYAWVVNTGRVVRKWGEAAGSG